jgi:hypothetical protein
MSSIIESTIPSLNYVSSVDVSESEYGHMSFEFLFNQAISGLGKVLMFEWKKTDPTAINSTPANVTLGFVNSENFNIQSGIQNNYILSVPSSDYDYNPDIPVAIAFRMYVGLEGSSDIAVTQWSNNLIVHSAPPQPVIDSAYFDSTSLDNDELYIFLDVNPSYKDDIKFVVAYYYMDAEGQTVWTVSDRLPSTLVTIGVDDDAVQKSMIHVQDFNVVSSNDLRVFVAVYATYNYLGLEDKNYYSVSHISETAIALPASDYSKPNITSKVYKVYEDRSQKINITWTPPENAGIPTFNVQTYQLERRVNGGAYLLIATTTASVLTYEDDISALNQTDNVVYKVRAISTFGTPSLYSNEVPRDSLFRETPINVFVYSSPVRNVVVDDTSIDNDNLVSMSVSFDRPLDIGPGTPLYYEILISSDGTFQDTIRVDYVDQVAMVHSIVTNGNISYQGDVEVRLVTHNTNRAPFDPDDPEVDHMRGELSDSKPYVAANLLLNDVDYKVYSDEGQDMLLSWNTPLPNVNAWQVTGYVVSKKVGAGSYSPVSGSLSDLSFTYDSSVDAENAELSFKVEATLTHFPLSNPPNTYTIVSNEKSINKFFFATQVQNVVVDDTSIDSDDLVSMSVSFDRPVNMGPGVPLYYEILISSDGFLQDTIRVDYVDQVAMVHLIENNENIWYQGDVAVRLVTLNTNLVPFDPNDSEINDMEGELSDNKPYVAANFLLDDVDYKVYSNKSQNMDLSWSDPLEGTIHYPWQVTSYVVSKKVGSGSYSPVSGSLSALSFTYDSSVDAENAELSFKVEATLTHYPLSTPQYTYTIVSNEKSINKFLYSSPVRNVVVDETSIDNANYVSMRISFDKPVNMGPGTPLYYEIIISTDGEVKDTISIDYVNQVTIVHRVETYDSLSYQGDVAVRLVTRDTNGTGEMQGELSASEPYVAANFLLNNVDYQVYSDNSQDMDLSWNTPLPNVNPWQVTGYVVSMKLENGLYSPVSNSLLALLFTYDSSVNSSCNTLLTFKVEATLTHISPSRTYKIESNETSIHKFYKSDAPQQLNVTWAVADVDKSYVDMRVTFANPASVGCGSVNKYSFNVLNSQGVTIRSVDVDYDSNLSVYTVNIDDLQYVPNGTVEVHLITADNNTDNYIDGGSATSYFEVSRIPVYTSKSLSSDRQLVMLQVVTASILDPIAAFINGSGPTMQYLPWSTEEIMSDDLSIVITQLINNEYQYSISLRSSFFSLTEFPNDFGIVISNSAGVAGAAF